MPAGRTAIVGAVNVDLVVTSSRLPGAGETVVGSGPRRFGGGKGANAAVAAARAGAEVTLVGAVGADETGAAALEDLRAEGISVDGVAVLPDEATGVALIVVDEAGENQIAVGAGANSALGPEEIEAGLGASIGTIDCVLVSTEIADDAITAALEIATRAGVRCLLNPAPPTEATVAGVHLGPILTPNRGELGPLLTGLGEESHAAPETAAIRLAARSDAPVVVTLGADGALLAVGETVEHMAAPVAEVRDTTGAGDTFNGVLAARLALGDDLKRALRLAIAAASLSVGKQGAREGMPDAAAIEAAVARRQPNE